MKLCFDVHLPPSKSESHRALMMAAYGGFVPIIQNLSESHDTKVLLEALHKAQTGVPEIDIADCGTAARFMTTYLACHDGDWLLTGTARMKQRPMEPLVGALVALGAEIQYVEQPGFLPLRIHGKSLEGGKVSVDITQSSQFASSLLLAAPMFPKGLEVELLGELRSLPYLDMTLALMCHFGAEAKRDGRTAVVKAKPYQSASLTVSSDWSAASYWYEMAAFCEECEIKLHGLDGASMGSRTSSLQGDSIIVDWMESLGVCTTVLDDCLVLTKTAFERKPLNFDFSDCPDLYPTMAATCAGLQVEAHFTGLANLRLKESDRVMAMQWELAKLGSHPLHFCAHGDHRVVMALAPLALVYGPVTFDCPEVVEKSYPHFWDDAVFLRFE